ncbi:MAG: adenylate/guanylate cyclase domain-containing protein [Ferrovibrio sp.]|uniref:adenylate/guanylate cyclase domain-containing protein n=1 Tax=Ferrovibrio sp. TaxID=1917215 RepID=UPI001B528BE5|nr:adenylate/guanylate cyclase domain-containing protein [Ferrovibrio sp.]
MAALRFVRVRPSIAQALVLGIGLLVTLAGIAYGIAMLSGRANTVELLRDRNQRIIERSMERIRGKLEPVRQHLEGLRDRIEHGGLSIDDPKRVGDYLTAMLDGVPQLDAVGVVKKDLSATRAARIKGRVYVLQDSLLGVPGTAERMRSGEQIVDALRAKGETTKLLLWGDLIWEQELRQALVNLRAPLLVNNEFVGGMAALVSLGSLSKALKDDAEGHNWLDGEGQSFILYDDNYVLAHASLVTDEYYLSYEKPLPFLEEVHDPVLHRIWSGRKDSLLARSMMRDQDAHLVEAEGRTWIFLYQKLEGYGERPWLVGRYFPFDEIENEVKRLQFAGAIGGVTLILSLLIAWRLGRIIGQPVRELAAAAHRLQALDFDGPLLQRQRLRELDEAAQAVNAATSALNWFGHYVPRRLVSRLMREGEDAVNLSKQREVTVMFTDIVGFTSLAEHLTAPEVAELLNHHFALLAGHIEADGGVIDKFIGDSVMAVWGAIKRDENHAKNACRAVLNAAAALAEDNRLRRAAGLPALRIRVGLHSGPVVVGNIGAPGRINYTVVGDTVNIAQRLEQLGREHMAATDDVVVLASHATVELAELDSLPPEIGSIAVKGRAAEVEIYRLAAFPALPPEDGAS